jgi:hypothetical protein
MTALLDPQAADRLAKLLGMIGSHHDGEVLAAARKADQCIRQLGLTWGDVIRVPTDGSSSGDWQHMARACRAQAHRLSAREFDFINNIAMARLEPSEKQLRWLHDIASRLRRAA